MGDLKVDPGEMYKSAGVARAIGEDFAKPCQAVATASHTAVSQLTGWSVAARRVGARRLGAAALAPCLSLILGGCASTPGPNDPLPVKARQDAQDWAKHMTEDTAQTAGAALDPGSVEPLFSDCVGRNDEVREDGRYKLSYAVYSSTPLEQHPEAVRKVRTMLEQQGFKIDGYRESANGKVDTVLDASQASSRYLITVETTSGGLLAFRVRTPCLMPPAATETPR
ncbi:hypothetical protein [Kitasatospora sp. NPDC058478]|uniref:hypothetical protein n=1 Tax=unclassified Kitasatospora TaxID=2633591 RepID=UPI00365910B9